MVDYSKLTKTVLTTAHTSSDLYSTKLNEPQLVHFLTETEASLGCSQQTFLHI